MTAEFPIKSNTQPTRFSGSDLSAADTGRPGYEPSGKDVSIEAVDVNVLENLLTGTSRAGSTADQADRNYQEEGIHSQSSSTKERIVLEGARSLNALHQDLSQSLGQANTTDSLIAEGRSAPANMLIPPSLGLEKRRRAQLFQKLMRTNSTETEFTSSKTELLQKYGKFKDRAADAFSKLTSAAKDSARTDNFRTFVSDLKSPEHVVGEGLGAFSRFIEGRIPEDLKSLYCMLHVFYAASLSLDPDDSGPMSDGEFACSAAEFKGCLPVISENGILEQDLYDEIVSVMWAEIEVGMKFADDLQEHIDAGEFDLQSFPVEGFDCDWDTELESLWTGLYGPDDPGGVNTSTEEEGAQYASQYRGEEFAFLHDGTVDPKLIERSPTPTATDFQGSIDLYALFHPPKPAWDTLYRNPIVTRALQFLQGIFFLCICTIIAASFIRSLPIGSPPVPPKPKLDSNQRQHIIDCLQSSLGIPTYPYAWGIISAVTKPFLEGTIDTLRDLENSIVNLLKLYSITQHAFEHFLTAIISHFRHYYHAYLPAAFKCPSDEYNSPDYLFQRMREENSEDGSRNSTDSPPSNVGATSVGTTGNENPSPPTVTAAVSSRRRCLKRAVPSSEEGDHAPSRRRGAKKQKLDGELKIIPYEYGRKRRRVLAALPKALTS
ncbi:hypothetical protein ABW19_dt0207657 [Dactylella cylindrospora]|nr:hypothetical protein ABW19_dt0207657 [Dactylella cylindrospora]